MQYFCITTNLYFHLITLNQQLYPIFKNLSLSGTRGCVTALAGVSLVIFFIFLTVLCLSIVFVSSPDICYFSVPQSSIVVQNPCAALWDDMFLNHHEHTHCSLF